MIACTYRTFPFLSKMADIFKMATIVLHRKVLFLVKTDLVNVAKA